VGTRRRGAWRDGSDEGSGGVASEIGNGAIRFSLGRTTIHEEIDSVVERLIEMFAIAE